MSAFPLSAQSLRHLCRSSPWRWQTVRFALHQKLPFNVGDVADAAASNVPDGGRGQREGDSPAAVNCWVRRPGALRVEALDGALLASTTRINASRDALYISGNRKPWLLPPALVNPIKDDDGYVVRRPEALYGEPAYGTGRASAALDPVELAGERPVALEAPFANVAEILSMAHVTHHGRAAVEAVMSPNGSYRPAFAEAPLLFPGRTAVRLDVETGICVASQCLDGPAAGAGHWMVLLGVDEYMMDDLFEEGEGRHSLSSIHNPF